MYEHARMARDKYESELKERQEGFEEARAKERIQYLAAVSVLDESIDKLTGVYRPSNSAVVNEQLGYGIRELNIVRTMLVCEARNAGILLRHNVVSAS